MVTSPVPGRFLVQVICRRWWYHLYLWVSVIKSLGNPSQFYMKSFNDFTIAEFEFDTQKNALNTMWYKIKNVKPRLWLMLYFIIVIFKSRFKHIFPFFKEIWNEFISGIKLMKFTKEFKCFTVKLFDSIFASFVLSLFVIRWGLIVFLSNSPRDECFTNLC